MSLSTSRLLCVYVDAPSNLETKVRRDLFRLNGWLEVPVLGFMERIFMMF